MTKSHAPAAGERGERLPVAQHDPPTLQIDVTASFELLDLPAYHLAGGAEFDGQTLMGTLISAPDSSAARAGK